MNEEERFTAIETHLVALAGTVAELAKYDSDVAHLMEVHGRNIAGLTELSTQSKGLPEAVAKLAANQNEMAQAMRANLSSLDTLGKMIRLRDDRPKAPLSWWRRVFG